MRDLFVEAASGWRADGSLGSGLRPRGDARCRPERQGLKHCASSQQVSAFILKHGCVYPHKKGWTMRYLRWLQEQKFDHPAHQIALQEND
jgi:hypothetical protein